MMEKQRVRRFIPLKLRIYVLFARIFNKFLLAPVQKFLTVLLYLKNCTLNCSQKYRHCFATVYSVYMYIVST